MMSLSLLVLILTAASHELRMDTPARRCYLFQCATALEGVLRLE